ncbi:DUF5388 domain-containing protein [Lactobacillus gallinarum]|uniref:DUF5388 domain-containing protein n=1 Tax=Lactobacillus gallinarum TaxID=52242 RepID=UPI0025A34622|nr:DUF5388 domain-containing protein [Lactobacillus gallinarum]MDM8281839.1 DUF5388 domain-containing protein [Lactobacillus gallinarum]
MSNLLHNNRKLEDLQPSATFDDKDLNNNEEKHIKNTKITKKHKEKTVNIKIDKHARDALVVMSMLSYAKNQKEAVNMLLERFEDSMSPSEKQIFDQQMNLISDKATGRMLG